MIYLEDESNLFHKFNVLQVRIDIYVYPLLMNGIHTSYVVAIFKVY